MRELDAARLRELVHYEPATGVFTWLGGPRKGRPAGSVNGLGYVQIKFSKAGFSAHRLAWLYTHGEFPKQDIDHINGIRNDNRIANLRAVQRRVNLQNIRSPRTDNKSSGMLGVEARGNRFRARIQVDGAVVSVGTFATATEAHNAYIKFKRQLHEGCTI